MTLPLELPASWGAMGAYRQFVTYRLVPNKYRPAKMDKLPCNWATGLPVNAHDPANWTDFATAAACATLANVGHGCGVGFVFTDADPFWFLDIDGAFDPATGVWSPLALALGAQLPGAAFEVSQSGRGCHFFGSGALPDHACKNVMEGLELYHRDRFVALSFAGAAGDPGTDLTAAIGGIAAHYFPPAQAGSEIAGWSAEPVPEWCGHSDDDKLLRAALQSTSTAGSFGGSPVMFRDLWTGDAEKLGARWPSEKGEPWNGSSADAALASHLAFWTGRNHQRILEIMSGCEALRRGKWERPDYLERTILRACGVTARVHQRDVKPPPPPPPAAVVEAMTAAGFSNGWSGAPDKADHLYIETVLVGVLGGVLRYDEFADRTLTPDGRVLTDGVETALYLQCRAIAGLPFGKDLFRDVVKTQAEAHPFHPVRDYFNAVQPTWDGAPRIDRWLVDYAGAEDTEFNRTVGSIFLRASVRRIRQPGCKYDELLVLESPQGWNKSTLYEALCPDPEWFTDEVHLGMDSKQLMEVTQGKMIVEMPELSKMGARDVESVKAMLSRRRDKARLAYGTRATEVGRQWIGGGNTNNDKYLTDPTGNRRFYPVRMHRRADIQAMLAVREQLWAEAAVRDVQGESIRLPEHLWAVAADLQESRVKAEPIFERMAEMLDGLTGRIQSRHIWDAMGASLEAQSRLSHARGAALIRLGWSHQRLRDDDGHRRYYYVKGDPTREWEWNVGDHRMVTAAPALRAV